MKKFVCILMSLILISSIFAGCVKQEDLKSDIVLITNGNTVNDNGYNQSAWDGINTFAQDNSMTCTYFQPVLEDNKITTENVEKYVELAVDNDAQFIVFPGEDFAVCTYEIAPLYPDVKFILLDAVPHSAEDNIDRYIANVMSVTFDALQSGYLAGYTAVASGNTELGFFAENNSKYSANYGAGFVQGAAYAADSMGIPVTVDWAEYDSPFSSYNYDFTITACYEPIADQKEKTFVVNVVDGIGSGTYTEGSNITITANPAPEGQVFDKWVVKSDTDGVKDKKVNISSKSESSMNLLVEKCDCTITATYKDIEGDYNNVTVMGKDGTTVQETFSVASGSDTEVTAPVAEHNMIFDHWDCEQDMDVSSLDDKTMTIKNVTSDIVLIPVFKQAETPTFNINVVTGEGGNGESYGNGSYVAGDIVDVSAAIPEDGYMFSHWQTTDAYGNSANISMENEYYWNTTFEMVDRYASICETMFNNGVTTIFTGGNSKEDSAFTAKGSYDCDLNIITAGANNSNAYFTIIKSYEEAVKDALEDFKGGSLIVADCKSEGIYSTFGWPEDKPGMNDEYEKIYSDLADGKIQLVHTQGGQGDVFCQYFNDEKLSKCLTLNGWFITNPNMAVPTDLSADEIVTE